MKSASIDRVENGLFDLVTDTKESEESLIQRSKVLEATSVLIKNLQLHSQRRLTGKLNADPDATVDKLFADFQAAVGGIT
jgi:hypothetical protein